MGHGVKEYLSLDGQMRIVRLANNLRTARTELSKAATGVTCIDREGQRSILCKNLSACMATAAGRFGLDTQSAQPSPRMFPNGTSPRYRLDFWGDAPGAETTRNEDSRTSRSLWASAPAPAFAGEEGSLVWRPPDCYLSSSIIRKLIRYLTESPHWSPNNLIVQLLRAFSNGHCPNCCPRFIRPSDYAPQGSPGFSAL